MSELHPGPLNPVLLTRQKDHISEKVWSGELENILNCRQSDDMFWSEVKERPIQRRVLQILIDGGFYGVYRAGPIKLDHSLITSLVERWRPETHTFHFRFGEATVTLQDVAVLYGLPVDGEPVVGLDRSRSEREWQDFCFKLLGFRPQKEEIDGSTLKINALKRHVETFNDITDDTDQLVVDQISRCYMMWLIAVMLFPETSGNRVKLMYLSQLQDISQIGKYSWGSAVLASLYRALCCASLGQKIISGFLPLLQVWVWLRLPVLRPDRPHTNKPIFPAQLPDLPGPPLANEWSVQFSWKHSAKYVLRMFRDQLDSLVERQFAWEPYTAAVMEKLPEYCRLGEHCWRAMVPMFCWDVMELHQPDRVLRQFGMRQNIPECCIFKHKHERATRRGRPNVDWTAYHGYYIVAWRDRATRTCVAPLETRACDEDYLEWYLQITRQLVGSPRYRTAVQDAAGSSSLAPTVGYSSIAPSHEAMARMLHVAYHVGVQLSREETTNVTGCYLMQMCKDGLQVAHEEDRLRFPPLYVPVQQQGDGCGAGEGGRSRKRRREGEPDGASTSGSGSLDLFVPELA